MQFTVTYTATISGQTTFDATDQDDANQRTFGEICLDLDNHGLKIESITEWHPNQEQSS